MPDQPTIHVYRYTVPVDDQWHEIELCGPIAYVASRSIYTVEFWSLHTVDAETWTESLIVVGTGHAVPPATEYVGTAIAPGGQLVWHLFRKVPDHG
jgi:hypothetical protein